MPEHKETRILSFSASHLFDIVSDIEKYPEFLPWCIACRIKEQKNNTIIADMAVGYKFFRETFNCKVILDPDAKTIDVSYISGPLKHLSNAWTFKDIDDGEACEVDFYLDYAFKSTVLQKIMDGFFDVAFKRMVASFEERAQDLASKSTP